MPQLKNFTIVLKGKHSLLLVALLGKSKGLSQPNTCETLSTASGFGCALHGPGVPSPASHHISVPSPVLRPLLKPNPALNIKKHMEMHRALWCASTSRGRTPLSPHFGNTGVPSPGGGSCLMFPGPGMEPLGPQGHSDPWPHTEGSSLMWEQSGEKPEGKTPLAKQRQPVS